VLLLAGLSTGNKVGIAVVAAVFISFAILSSFVAPRRWPDFPGRNGLSVFVLASFVLFAAMLTAVAVLAVEHEGGEAQAAGESRTIDIDESEFKIVLAPASGFHAGSYTFVVRNTGEVGHDLVIAGPNNAPLKKTAVISPGGEAKLTVALRVGGYTLYCSVDGHRAAGMETTLTVG
jgi:uncharacterized cupredoxin-like copper-binding protein